MYLNPFTNEPDRSGLGKQASQALIVISLGVLGHATSLMTVGPICFADWPKKAKGGHAMPPPPPPAFAPPQTCFFPPDDRRGLVCLGVTRARAAPLPLHSLGRPNICSVQWLVMEKESRGGSREGRKGPRWIHRSTEHQNNQQDDQERSERMGRMGRKFGITRCVENAALESFVDCSPAAAGFTEIVNMYAALRRKKERLCGSINLSFKIWPCPATKRVKVTTATSRIES